MDDPAIDPRRLEHALSGLARLNLVSGAFNRTFSVIAREARTVGGPLTVLDFACARGDFVLDAAARAGRLGLPIEFSGCDLNARCITLARQRADARGLACPFFTLDAMREHPDRRYDIATASLFLHHLTDEQAVDFLRRMAECSSLVIVNDLVRSRHNLAAVALASRVLTTSPVVHTDAALSVRAAFTRREMYRLAERAGLSGATILFGGISRMMLVRRKPR